MDSFTYLFIAGAGAGAAGTDEEEERILCARDGLEQYVMCRLGDLAFRAVAELSQEQFEGECAQQVDKRLSRRMKLLSFLTPEVPPPPPHSC